MTVAGVPAADPFSAFAGSFGSGLGKGVGDMLSGGGGGPFVGGSSSAAAYGTTLDGGGWIVNVGGQQDATSSPVRTTTNTPTIGSGEAAGFFQPQQAGLSPVVALLLLSVVAGVMLRKRGG